MRFLIEVYGQFIKHFKPSRFKIFLGTWWGTFFNPSVWEVETSRSLEFKARLTYKEFQAIKAIETLCAAWFVLAL